MSLAGAIVRLRSGSYSVTRTTARTYTLGKLNSASTSSLTIVASIQPTSGRELQDMPEGMRTDELVTIYTSTALQTKTSTAEPDKVAIGSDSYEVVRVQPWIAFGETHYRAFARKVGS